MVKRQIAPRPKDGRASREHEFEIRCITERRCRNANAASRCRAATAYPTPAMEIHRLASWRINSHRFVTVGRQEEVAVIGSYHAILDTGAGQLSNSSGDVVNHGVHDLSRLIGEPAFASVIDFLGADHNNLSVFDLLCEL